MSAHAPGGAPQPQKDNGPRATIIAACITGGLALIGTFLGGVQTGRSQNDAATVTRTVSSVVTKTVTGGDNTSASDSPTGSANNGPRVTPMVLPVPESPLNYTGVDIGPPDANGGGMSDFYYQRDETDNSPTVKWHSTGSTNNLSKGTDREGCLTALRTAPLNVPLRDLHAGALFCVGDPSGGGGVALFEITQAPGKDGTMKVTEYFWAGS
jgi:hypothetical protein